MECRDGLASPSNRTVPRPIPFSSAMKGQKAVMNHCVGLTTSSAVRSAYSRAMVLGASSPSTMWSAVMKAKAMATASEWAE